LNRRDTSANSAPCFLILKLCLITQFRKIFSHLQVDFLFSLKQQDGGRPTVSSDVTLTGVIKESLKPGI
jgi:hypothetical protein